MHVPSRTPTGMRAVAAVTLTMNGRFQSVGMEIGLRFLRLAPLRAVGDMTFVITFPFDPRLRRSYLSAVVGERLRRLRTRLGLSQEALARLLGVSFATVNRWESDKQASGPRGVVLVFVQALEAASHSDPALSDRLVDWTPRGQPYVLQRVLALAYPAGAQVKRSRR
jgi:putative transcriptional regulator